MGSKSMMKRERRKAKGNLNKHQEERSGEMKDFEISLKTFKKVPHDRIDDYIILWSIVHSFLGYGRHGNSIRF